MGLRQHFRLVPRTFEKELAMIEEGMMVEVTAAAYKEKMTGLVGLVVEKVMPNAEGDTGEETLFRVEFMSNRLKLPQNLPTYWPAADLQEAK